jgi:hypothetical protein
MEAVGRLINPMPAMDGKYVSCKATEGVTFVGYLASTGDTYTLVEAKDAAGTGAQNLVKITRFHTCTGDGSDAWVLTTQAAAATAVATAAANQSAIMFEIDGSMLSDTYKYIKVTSTGAGTVAAIQHDLMVQRKPANLAAVGV